ncbi:MAG: NAD(P)H-hydrate dehydratase [Dehalococcoidia bacterium]|nr:NAD(P)H-hydrate dehydratase [Dehalococcoidia bacterium]
MRVSSVDQMREMDRGATEQFGIDEMILMENAGNASCFVIWLETEIQSRKFVVFCGTGNNGGDGFVVARKLHSMGGDVVVFLLGNPDRLKGAARKNHEIIARMPVDIREISSALEAEEAVYGCDTVVDAIFGTGLDREVTGLQKEVIELINGSQKMVFSLDIPSGVNGNTGQIMGTAVRSDFTITYGLPKLGNMLYPGFALCGKLYVTPISFPPALYEQSIKVRVNDFPGLPKRNEDTHKGDFGKALFIAGSTGYLGAPCFAALSFLKAGGGLSYLAAPRSISPFFANKASEVVLLPRTETNSGSLAADNLDSLLDFSTRVDFVVLGPGISLEAETQELARELAARIKAPLLLDGDGITAVVQAPEVIRSRPGPTILTPHSGEMARLTGMTADEVNADRIRTLQKTTRELNSTIVLKGAHSLIGFPDGRVYINTSGNPGMATAGSGDALTGAIAAMYGMGLPLEEAVRAGVFMHGLSGDLAAAEKGEDGITGQDIVEYLPNAVKFYRENLEKLRKNCYESVFTV